MNQWALTGYGKPFELIQRPLPKLVGTQVLLKNLYSGVCHSELHMAEGKWDMGGGNIVSSDPAKLPCVLGHEMEAEVLELGPDAPKTVQVGGRYIVFPWIGCGPTATPCKCCAQGNENTCIVGNPGNLYDGSSMYGGYGSHVVSPHPKYLIDASGLPDSIPRGLSCVYICSGLTVYSALKKIGTPLGGGGDVMIVGCGGLGLQAVQFAKALFGSAPRAADIAPHARKAAEGLGATVYDPSAAGQAEKVKAASGGGLHAAIDFVGGPKTSGFAADCVRRGGIVIVVGLAGGGPIDKPMLTYPTQSLTVRGSLVGTLSEAHEMFGLLRKGAVQPIPHHFRDISDVNDVHAQMRAGAYVGRCVLRHGTEGGKHDAASGTGARM